MIATSSFWGDEEDFAFCLFLYFALFMANDA